MGTEPIDEGLCRCIMSEITREILDETSMMYGSIEEDIIELMEERFRALRANLATD